MIAQFDKVNLKIWFSNNGTSRNLQKVVEIDHVGNLMKVELEDGKTVLINFDNVNMIEEVSLCI